MIPSLVSDGRAPWQPRFAVGVTALLLASCSTARIEYGLSRHRMNGTLSALCSPASKNMHSDRLSYRTFAFAARDGTKHIGLNFERLRCSASRHLKRGCTAPLQLAVCCRRPSSTDPDCELTLLVCLCPASVAPTGSLTSFAFLPSDTGLGWGRSRLTSSRGCWVRTALAHTRVFSRSSVYCWRRGLHCSRLPVSCLSLSRNPPYRASRGDADGAAARADAHGRRARRAAAGQGVRGVGRAAEVRRLPPWLRRLRAALGCEARDAGPGAWRRLPSRAERASRRRQGGAHAAGSGPGGRRWAVPHREWCPAASFPFGETAHRAAALPRARSGAASRRAASVRGYGGRSLRGAASEAQPGRGRSRAAAARGKTLAAFVAGCAASKTLLGSSAIRAGIGRAWAMAGRIPIRAAAEMWMGPSLGAVSCMLVAARTEGGSQGACLLWCRRGERLSQQLRARRLAFEHH